MTPNIGSTDKMIRLAVAVIIAILFLAKVVTLSSTLGVVLFIVAILMVITGLLNYCPLYPFLKMNTRKR